MTTLRRNPETGELERTDRNCYLIRHPRTVYRDEKCSRCGRTPHFHSILPGFLMVAHPFRMGRAE